MFRSKEIDTIINLDAYDSHSDIYFFKKLQQELMAYLI